jgi:hypothetical protein
MSGAFSEPSSIAPATRITAGPRPSCSYTIDVPSFDVTRSMPCLLCVERVITIDRTNGRVVLARRSGAEVRLEAIGQL